MMIDISIFNGLNFEIPTYKHSLKMILGVANILLNWISYLFKKPGVVCVLFIRLNIKIKFGLNPVF